MGMLVYWLFRCWLGEERKKEWMVVWGKWWWFGVGVEGKVMGGIESFDWFLLLYENINVKSLWGEWLCSKETHILCHYSMLSYFFLLANSLRDKLIKKHIHHKNAKDYLWSVHITILSLEIDKCLISWYLSFH